MPDPVAIIIPCQFACDGEDFIFSEVKEPRTCEYSIRLAAPVPCSTLAEYFGPLEEAQAAAQAVAVPIVQAVPAAGKRRRDVARAWPAGMSHGADVVVGVGQRCPHRESRHQARTRPSRGTAGVNSQMASIPKGVCPER
jgi:hypothetical protein